MATFKSTTKSAQEAAALKAGSYISDAELISGKIRFAQATLVVPAGTAAADVLELIDLPAGSTPIPALCSVVGAAAGAGTLSIGTAADPDAFCAGLSISAAGTKPLGSSVGSVPKFAARTTIQAVLATAGLTEAVTVYFNFAYSTGE